MKSLLRITLLFFLITVTIFPYSNAEAKAAIFKWSFIEAPFTFIQLYPYETETWTFIHPGASAMKVHLGRLDFSSKARYEDQKSKLEILDGNDIVLQTIKNASSTPFETIAVPGDTLRIRYVNDANGGVGVQSGASYDAFTVTGYSFKRLDSMTEGSGPVMNYSIFSPLPLPSSTVDVHQLFNYEMDITVKRAFNSYTENPNNLKLDFFVDATFLGSARGYQIPGDTQNIYFNSPLNLAEWLQTHGESMSTLVLREVRFVNPARTNWRTQYQYLNFPIQIADPRTEFIAGFDIHQSSELIATLNVTDWSMVGIWTQWTLSSNNPVDIDMDIAVLDDDFDLITIAESTHHGIQEIERLGSFGEGFSLWLSPGTYYIRVHNPGGGCSGTSAGLHVLYDASGEVYWTPGYEP